MAYEKSEGAPVRVSINFFMLLLNRFLPFSASLLIFALFEAFFFLSWNYFFTVIAILLIAWLALWQLHGRKWLEKNLWSFFIAPSFFLSGGFFFFLFFENVFLFHALALISAFLMFLFFYDLFLFLHHPFRYQAYSLENISNTVNLISVWYWSASLFGSIILLQFSVAVVVLIFFCLMLFLEYEIFWIHKFDLRSVWPRMFLTSFILSEFFVALSFFPTGFYTNGSVLTAIFYLFSGMERRHLLKRLDSKALFRYLGIGLGTGLLILLTARWE